MIPVVLHHSESGWTAARSIGELGALPEALRDAASPFVPELEIVVDDLALVSEQELLAREMAALAKLVVWTLRLVRLGYDPALIVQWAQEAHEASTHAPREAFRAAPLSFRGRQGDPGARRGELPADVTERVRLASVPELDRGTERVLTAPSLDLLFAE